jgi:hypothetical protein
MHFFKKFLFATEPILITYRCFPKPPEIIPKSFYTRVKHGVIKTHEALYMGPIIQVSVYTRLTSFPVNSLLILSL